MEPFTVKSTLHSLAGVLEIPAIIVLVCAVAVTAIMVGSLIAELVAQRRGVRRDSAKTVAAMRGKGEQGAKAAIQASGLASPQKKALLAFLPHASAGFTPDEVEALAAETLAAERSRVQAIVSVTDTIARVGPMVGLMATLIPLGPGLIALGQGDTLLLSQSLLTAFDATVSGLAASFVAYIVSRVRRGWYTRDAASFESVLVGLLDEVFKAGAERIAPEAADTASRQPARPQPPIEPHTAPITDPAAKTMSVLYQGSHHHVIAGSDPQSTRESSCGVNP
ncbi:MAG: MotA/TolQ/ExbB proton channel family protein [Clostridiales Family XIII bacterium]|nr:MotA/TolQ/ExbB proton channel family protein [Clostridiales Family XIII bacterium]